jgi:hypothetical protein
MDAISRPGERPAVEFVIKEGEAAIACGRRSVSDDGAVMTIEMWTAQLNGGSPRTREVWRRSK